MYLNVSQTKERNLKKDNKRNHSEKIYYQLEKGKLNNL